MKYLIFALSMLCAFNANAEDSINKITGYNCYYYDNIDHTQSLDSQSLDITIINISYKNKTAEIFLRGNKIPAKFIKNDNSFILTNNSDYGASFLLTLYTKLERPGKIGVGKATAFTQHALSIDGHEIIDSLHGTCHRVL